MKQYQQERIMTACVHAGKREGDPYGVLPPVDWSGIYTNIHAGNGNVNQFALQDKLC